MAKANVYEITLKPLSKKQKEEAAGFFNVEDDIEISFGKKGNSWLELDATGLVKTLFIDGETALSDVNIADLAKAYLKQEKRAAKRDSVESKVTAVAF